jgi:PAS domain S-box-containing protein
MEDQSKTKQVLIQELVSLRQRIAGIEQSESDRKRVEETLRESENKYRLLADNVKDVIFVLDMNLNYTYVSPSVKILRGYEPEEVLKQQSIEQTLTPSSMDLAMKALSEIMELEKLEHKEDNISRTLPLEIRRKDGSTVWTETKVSFIRDKDQQPVGILGITRDITERKQAADALLESEERYRLITENTAHAIALFDLNLKPTAYVTPSILKLRGYTVEEAMTQTLNQTLTPDSLELVSKIFAEQMALESSGTADPARTALMELEEYCKDGSTIWVEIAASFLRDNNFKPTGILTVTRDITERKQAEEALRESEEKFRMLSDQSLLAIGLIQKGLFKYVNQAFCDISGYTSAEIMTWQPYDFVKIVVHPDDEALVMAPVDKEQTYAADVARRFEFRGLTKNGKTLWLNLYLKAVLYQGRYADLLSFVDITERKQAEEALKKSEKKYRLLADNVKDVIFVLDMNLNYTYVSPSIKILRGYEPEEVLKQSYIDILTPSSMHLAMKTLSDVMELEKIKHLEITESRTLQLEMKRKDGSTVCTEVKFSFIRDENQRPVGILGITRDITDRKNAEEKLRESERQYRLLTEKMSDIVWITDMNLRTIYISPSIKNVLGFSQEERMRQKLDEQLTPQSLSLVLEALSREFALEEQGNADPNRTLTIELEYYHKDGSTRWMELVISGLRNDQGVLTRIHGVSRDITDRKRAEDELRKSEEKYRLIFEYSPLGLLSFDEKGVIIACNDNFVKIIGSSREKLIGLNMLNLPDKKMVSTIRKALKGSIGVYEDDYHSVTAKKITPTRAIFAPIDVGGGRIPGGMGIIEDITERKQAEKALREGEELYRTIFENTGTSMILIEEDMTISMSNGEFVRNTGYSPDEINGRMKWTEIIHPDDLERMVEQHRLRRESQGGALPSYEFRYITKKGDLRDTLLTIKLVPGTKKSIASLIDITKRKQAEEKLQQTLESLKRAVGTTIQVLVSASESRDPYTAGHQKKSADVAVAIAMEMGLAQDKIEGIRMAGIIHDIGKLSIPAEILSKPSKLTEIEFSLIKEHTRSGYEMLKDVESPWPLAEIVYQHHERMNGSGYPRNLKGGEILMEARILAVADVLEAMASHRPYRAALGIEAALEEIEKNKGILYDNAVVDACLRLFREKGYKLK